MTLDDKSPMPFGAHKGKSMESIRPSYFHYLWHNGIKNHSAGSPQEAVYKYIEHSIPAFKKEEPDLIWS